jgi:hypothetical protein
MLNIVKLCVGSDSVEDLEEWIAFRLEEKRLRGEAEEHVHTTRMMPKQVDAITDGGSLYWVIKGNIQCRQRILAIRSFTDRDGIGRCQIVLDPNVVRTEWQPRRAFQGWRYLKAAEAPRDLKSGSSGWQALPQNLRQELANLGLL